MAAAMLGLNACGSSNDTPDTPEVTQTVRQRSCSVVEGSEVEASTTVITLEYNTTVSVAPSANITLNGSKMVVGKNAQTAMKVDVQVKLEPGTDYTLTVPAGSVVSTVSPQSSAPDFTLHFKTPKEQVVDYGDIDDLCDKQATAETKALYDLLRQNYGKKMFSSVMADVNWNTTIADRIAAQTGRHPAFNCYDFIHICYSKKGSWIDYSDLSPVTTWVSQGGLVQLMWHFNVPTDSKQDLEHVTCTPSSTTFKAGNALKEGTWENKWFYDQMDKVADVILALQQQKIAAVWRPFHEAAGNATAKQQAEWTRSWFWWGYDGAETYKKLYRTMFEYFQKKGIHNLIWVWTTQNYNGDASKYNVDSDWYPGDDCVDIVGRDLYAYTSAQNKQEFTEIAARYPKKMVALAECGDDAGTKGKFDAMGAVWNAGAHWSWFMPWYGSNLPDDAWWKAALTNANVITREDLK